MSGTGSIFRLTLPACVMLVGLPISAASAQTKDNAPVALPSASMMRQDKPGSESWTYAQPAARFLKYRTLIVETPSSTASTRLTGPNTPP